MSVWHRYSEQCNVTPEICAMMWLLMAMLSKHWWRILNVTHHVCGVHDSQLVWQGSCSSVHNFAFIQLFPPHKPLHVQLFFSHVECEWALCCSPPHSGPRWIMGLLTLHTYSKRVYYVYIGRSFLDTPSVETPIKELCSDLSITASYNDSREGNFPILPTS